MEKGQTSFDAKLTSDWVHSEPQPSRPADSKPIINDNPPENMSKQEPSDNPPAHKLLPKVMRFRISEWYKRAENSRRPHGPSEHDEIQSAQETYVVSAYYQEDFGELGLDPDSSDLPSQVTSKDRSNTGPLRLVISSEHLIRDLQDLANVYLHQRPLALIPPFKLLIHNWDGIKRRLHTLREAHDSFQSSHAHRPLGPTSATTRIRIEYLQCLHDLMEAELAYYRQLQRKLEDCTLEDVSFEQVYLLFSPGDLVISRETGTDQLYRVYGVTGGRMRLNVPNPMLSTSENERDDMAGVGTWTSVKVQSFLMAWDGKQIGPIPVPHRIDHFPGRRPVTELEVFPLRFLKDAKEIRERLRLRGQKPTECEGHKKHIGFTVQPHWALEVFRYGTQHRTVDAGAWRPWTAYAQRKASEAVVRELYGDVFVDYQQGYRFTFENHAEIGSLAAPCGDPREVNESISSLAQMDITYTSGDYDVDGSRTDNFLLSHRHLAKPSKPAEYFSGEEARLELLSPFVLAYDFKSRAWVWVDGRNLEPINKSEEVKLSGWNELVIPVKYRKLLLSVIDSHHSGFNKRQWASRSQARDTQIDLVRGKGKGLVILLHGPPGTGKTSTAETIAAYTGRPLYSITCGDIGTYAAQVEEQLAKHTRLAETWGCVLLLDEADVFLEQRSWKDMGRNALVSVFLRQLEFYSGILFLTTNMVGVIDEAFRSRIHLSLQFPRIDLFSTLEIWSTLLQRIANDNENSEVQVKFNKDKLLAFSRRHYETHERSESTWNGRQIRNAFQLAIAMDQSDRLQRIKRANDQQREPCHTITNEYGVD